MRPKRPQACELPCSSNFIYSQRFFSNLVYDTLLDLLLPLSFDALSIGLLCALKRPLAGALSCSSNFIYACGLIKNPAKNIK
jgi:hypothetical protein